MPSTCSRDIPKSLIFRVLLSVTRQFRAARSLESRITGSSQVVAQRHLGHAQVQLWSGTFPAASANGHLAILCLLSSSNRKKGLLALFTRVQGDSLVQVCSAYLSQQPAALVMGQIGKGQLTSPGRGNGEAQLTLPQGPPDLAIGWAEQTHR